MKIAKEYIDDDGNFVQEFYPTQRIYAIKPSCPRDLGTFYCQDCLDEKDNYYEWSDPDGCEDIFEDKICGMTHNGYYLCKECEEKGFAESHGEYVVVGAVGG